MKIVMLLLKMIRYLTDTLSTKLNGLNLFFKSNNHTLSSKLLWFFRNGNDSHTLTSNRFLQFFRNDSPNLSSNRFVRFFRNGNDSGSVVKESLIALLICAVGDLCAGLILGRMTYFLEAFPGLMVFIPGAIGMRGNIFGALGSRLSSNLHIGLLSSEFKKSKLLMENIFSSLILTLILSIFLAVLAKIICFIFNFQSMSLIDFILISIFAGVISSVIMLPLTMLISLKSFQNGWDPDNITTPLIAAFGDLFTLPAIILSIMVLSIIPGTILKYLLFTIAILVLIVGIYKGISYSKEMKQIIKQSTPVLLFCSLLGVSAGGFLNNSISTLVKNPSLLTLVPLFSGESGNLVSILGARLSSALHFGLIEPILKFDENIKSNLLIIVILAIFIYPIIGFLAEFSSLIFGNLGVGFVKVVSISTISGMILLSIMLFFVFYISLVSYKKGLDPDNIVIPISTSITDSISSLILVTTALFILNLF